MKIKSEVMEYTFCSGCAQDGYIVLTAKPNRTDDEEDLLKKLRRFISN